MKGFYITVKRGNRTGWIAGPFAEASSAEAILDKAREAAARVDAWTAFDAFGTASMEVEFGERLPEAALNAELGLRRDGAFVR